MVEAVQLVRDRVFRGAGSTRSERVWERASDVGRAAFGPTRWRRCLITAAWKRRRPRSSGSVRGAEAQGRARHPKTCPRTTHRPCSVLTSLCRRTWCT